jgi:hypothetical protein
MGVNKFLLFSRPMLLTAGAHPAMMMPTGYPGAAAAGAPAGWPAVDPAHHGFHPLIDGSTPT